MIIITRAVAYSTICAMLFSLCTHAHAQQGTAIIPVDPIATVSGYGSGTYTVVPVSDAAVPFTQAVQLEQSTASLNNYDSAIGWSTTQDIKQGDLLIVSYWVRNANADLKPLVISPEMQLNVTPFTSIFESNAPVDVAGWKRYGIPFRAGADYPTGTASFNFRYASAAQKFEVGGISVQDYGQIPNSALSGLQSQLAFYYPGRGDANAPWRIKALNTIETKRKGNLSIKVVDANGNAISGARINAIETISQFKWGSAIRTNDLIFTKLQPSAVPLVDRIKYRAAIQKNFNSSTMEGAMTWPDWEYDRQNALSSFDWLKSHAAPVVRGIHLIWPGFDPNYQ